MKNINDFMLTSGAARILGVTPDRVRQLANAGRIPVATFVGNVRVFRKADVIEFNRKRRTVRAGER